MVDTCRSPWLLINPNHENTHSTYQLVTPDVELKLTFTEAKYLDSPTTKRRKLNGDHSSLSCEAYTLPQQDCWPQQTYLPLGQNDLGGHCQLYTTQPSLDHSQQPQASLAQQDNGLNRQDHLGQPLHERNVEPHFQQPYVESESQYRFKSQHYSENTSDGQGWDLARLHQRLRTVQGSDGLHPSPITRYQIPFSQHDLVTQKVQQFSGQGFDDGNFYPMRDVHEAPYNYNSRYETSNRTSSQIKPGKEFESAKTSHLDVSNLTESIEHPLQNTQELQCSVYSTLHNWKSQPSGQGFDLQQDIVQKTSQSQELQGQI